MRIKSLSWFSPFLLLVMAGCLEKYQAPEIKSNLNLLVVDGLINPGDNTAAVRLSRTTKLSENISSTPERFAQVTLEEIGGGTAALAETQSGLYTASGLSLNLAKQYRVHIQTTGSKTYASTNIELKSTPPIDDLSWEASPEGIHIYLSTHDPSNSSWYYLWDYVETFQHTAFWNAGYTVLNQVVVRRTPEEQAETYRCWTTIPSTNILVGSSKHLSEDVVNRFPVMFIPKGSLKVTEKYSILVNQQAITEESFKYWQQLQKTTENLGGLFDPLPSQVVGNVHSENSKEPVLGFISGGSIKNKRIFISSYELPSYLQINAFGYNGCAPDTLKGLQTLPEGLLMLSPSTSSSGRCVDCRVDGGSSAKPAFWP